MSIKKCPKCEKVFTRNESLQYHIDNNACKEYEFNCQYCGKGFTTNMSMCRHISLSCKKKKENDINKNNIYNSLIEKMELMEITHKKAINELTKKIKSLESNETKKCVISKGNNNTINTGTVHNTTNNIVIVGHGKEDMSRLDSADILKVLKNGYNSTIHLTETVHFNPKYPEYQNIYISNMKDKYAMMYDGNKWVLITKDDLIDKIYDNKKNYIEDNLDRFIESLPKIYINSLKRWLDTDETDPRIAKIKQDIKLLLYNSRDIPLNTIKDIPLNTIKDIPNTEEINPDTNSTKHVKNLKIKSNKCVKPNTKQLQNKKIIILDETDETSESDNQVVFAKSKPYINTK